MSGYDEKKKRIINVIKDKHYNELKQKELAFLLQVEQKDREEFRQLLAELVKEGKVLLTKRGKYQSLSDVTKIGVFCGPSEGLWFCLRRGRGGRLFYSGVRNTWCNAR